MWSEKRRRLGNFLALYDLITLSTSIDPRIWGLRSDLVDSASAADYPAGHVSAEILCHGGSALDLPTLYQATLHPRPP